jgi:alkylated DNA repair protein (DNA oxidative demethylase)
MPDLFEGDSPAAPWKEPLSEGATFLHGFALAVAPELLSNLTDLVKIAPFRRMETPGGFRMSVAMTSCGAMGWTTDARGYRYSPIDPESGKSWPAMPESFSHLSEIAASAAGFLGFRPDACLINRYKPGARMSLHQDRNERDRDAPIVSVSLGLPATFLFGGNHRSDAPTRLRLEHGDVLVWGGPDRMRFHGVLPVKSGDHEATGNCRINLTFRKAL